VSSRYDNIDINSLIVKPEVVLKGQLHFGGTQRTKVVSHMLIQLAELIVHFEWRHARFLIGTCMCWLLHLSSAAPNPPVNFYGVNLNQNINLEQISYVESTSTPWKRLFVISTSGLIITTRVFLLCYHASIRTIEIHG